MIPFDLKYLLSAFSAVCVAAASDIPPEQMRAIYDEVKTPYKYGVVIPAPEGKKVDCPTVFRHGDRWYMLWVMFYFGAFWKPKAFDTFAASRDLVHWTRWDGPHLIEPSEPWDAEYAHKPWLLKHNGVVYHFYCAVGNQERAIALATSRPMKEPGL
jgi:hypothetical protein